jgi:hypothetical protein
MQVEGKSARTGGDMPMELEDRELLNECCEALQNTHTAMMNILETLKDLQKGQMVLMAMAQQQRDKAA